MVREGAAVIDVGINYVQDPTTGKTKLVGDVDFEGKNPILLLSKGGTPIPAFMLSERNVPGDEDSINAHHWLLR